MNNSLDRSSQASSPTTAEGARYPARIEALCTSLHLFDVWRKLPPAERQFSFRRGQSASRLDYWFASKHMLDSETLSDIIPFTLSDHSAITIQVGERPVRRGPGLWRLDNSLIGNETFRDSVHRILREESDNTDISDPMALWDWIK